MNEYQAFLNMRSHRIEMERHLRNAQFVADLREIEKAQPRRLRFHLRFLSLNGFRLRLHRQPRTTHTALNAR